MAVEEPTAVAQEAPVEVSGMNKESALLEGKIIRQVEYYFGDLNMSKDKFMQEEVQKDEGCKCPFYPSWNFHQESP